MLTVSPVSAASPLADRPGLLHDVEPSRGGAGQPEEPDAQAVLAAVGGLLDEPVGLERADQAEGGALVHPELGRHLGDPDLAAPGQHLEDGDGPIDRLDAAAVGPQTALPITQH